jgi:cytoplasmic iron level regulating protein YaaA (DUF328/UPF0246 family)
MIPRFARFYGYTVNDILNEYAIVFFSLVNSMYEIIATEMLNDITVVGAVNSKDGGHSIISNLQKQVKGLGAIVEEVKIAKNARSKK